MNGKALRFYCEMYLLCYIFYCETNLPQVNVSRVNTANLGNESMIDYKKLLVQNVGYETISVDFSQQTQGMIYRLQQFSHVNQL